MSETECHKGLLYRIQQMSSLEETAKFHLESVGVVEDDIEYYDSWLDYAKSNGLGVVYNGELYRIENTEYDPYEGLSEATENPDGSVSYHLRFYNGGGGFSEVLDYALSKLRANSHK